MGARKVDRRAFLALSAIAGGSLPLSGCGWLAALCKPNPSPPSDAGASCDIHCHVFNARDLPIDGFIDDIYLSAGKGVRQFAERAFISFVRAAMDVQAISAREEADRINHPGRARAPDPYADELSDFSAEANRELLRSRIRTAASALDASISRARPAGRGRRRSRGRGAAAFLAAQQEILLATLANNSADYRSRRLRAGRGAAIRTPNDVADGVLGGAPH